MKKFLTLLFVFIQSYTVFSQSYHQSMFERSRISVVFKGSNMTVKWENSKNGITTKNAICQPFKTTLEMKTREGYNLIEKERKCKCTDNSGNYFIFRLSDISYYIDFYNELGGKIWDYGLSED